MKRSTWPSWPLKRWHQCNWADRSPYKLECQVCRSSPQWVFGCLWSLIHSLLICSVQLMSRCLWKYPSMNLQSSCSLLPFMAKEWKDQQLWSEASQHTITVLRGGVGVWIWSAHMAHVKQGSVNPPLATLEECTRKQKLGTHSNIMLSLIRVFSGFIFIWPDHQGTIWVTPSTYDPVQTLYSEISMKNQLLTLVPFH